MSEPARSAPRTAAALAARHRDTQAALGRVHDTIARLRREKTPVSVAAVRPSSRETVSRSSPRNSRSTAAVLRWRDIRPPRPSPTAPDPWARSASCGPTPTWFV